MSTLAIISHTEHYELANGNVVGLGSTVTEINHLLEIFDHIIHVAMLHDAAAPPSALPYLSDKIRFVALPPVGGHSFSDKIAIGFQAPKIIGIVRRTLKEADYFQFRAPTGIGVYVIPYLILFNTRKGWYKYAGNWKPEHAPLAYRFQKWCLEHQSRPVTINGFWEAQPEQCLSFENPCLSDQEIAEGQLTITEKTLQFPIEICFVGRLEAAKGLDLIIDAFLDLDERLRQKIDTIHLVGDGSQRAAYEKRTEHSKMPFVFHGYLSRAEVHAIYKRSHAILLPSASEGFPKVIAEAMNYGCIPIVSNVSSIGHYIQDDVNGFLMSNLTVSALQICLSKLFSLDKDAYNHMISTTREFINRFSYSYYNQRLKRSIL